MGLGASLIFFPKRTVSSPVVSVALSKFDLTAAIVGGAIRFLQKMQFTLQASALLDEIIQEKHIVRLQFDENIKLPEIKKQPDRRKIVL